MKLLLLGADFDMLPLLRAIAESDDFRVLGWHDSYQCEDRLRELFPAGRRIVECEDFSRSSANAIVVAADGGDADARETLLRDLARDSVPLVLIQPACSAIFAVELDMIQRDTHAPIIPIHLESLQPAISFLVEVAQNWDNDSAHGNLEQVVMERTVHKRDDETVNATLARDAMILRRLVGEFQKVGAMQAGAEKSLANLSVHLTGSSGVIARWSIGPVDNLPGATLSMIGQNARITLQMPDEGKWEITSSATVPIAGLQQIELETNPSNAVLRQIRRGLEGDPITPSWEDAFRSLDLADMASESVRRGKTLTVSNARVTEEDTFKGMMAAGGCLIILVLPLLLLVVSLIDGLQIPYKKSTVLAARPAQIRVELPADLTALDTVRIAGSQTELQLMTAGELYEAYGIRTKGKPQAFSMNGSEITLAPIPDEPIKIEVRYEGSFNIWKGWPLVLLTPILIFLLLQLLKLAFPKPAGKTVTQ